MAAKDSIRPVRSSLDLQEQINAGINLDGWEPEHLERIFEDSIRLQALLAEADEALSLAGINRGTGNVRDRILTTLKG